MAVDAPTPLASAADMQAGPFGNLVSGYSPTALASLMVQATRMCESEVHRRLAPFTTTESHRAEGIDPDEYADAANLPMDIQGTLGRSYAHALGASTLVRHVWLDQCAPMYPEMWAYSNVSVQIVRSYGGSQNMTPAQLIGPEPDSGHLWFQLGVFLPVGSMIRVTYSGGYQTIPADLVQAAKYMAASIAVRELDPQDNDHDPDLLHKNASGLLANWSRS